MPTLVCSGANERPGFRAVWRGEWPRFVPLDQAASSGSRSPHGREPAGASEICARKPFSERAGREKAIELLRWALVPCVAVLVGFVAPRLILSYLMPPALAQPPGAPRVPPSDFQRLYLPWIANIVAGAETAPRGRLVTAFILVTLWTLFPFYFHVLIHPHRDIRHYTGFLVSTLAAASGAAYIAYSEKRSLRGVR